MTPLILYRQQAAKEQDAADAAVLENVRDRSRRAAEAWTKLASQIEYADELRAVRQAAVNVGGHSTEPSEKPDRERGSNLRKAVGSTQSTIGNKGGDRGGLRSEEEQPGTTQAKERGSAQAKPGKALHQGAGST